MAAARSLRSQLLLWLLVPLVLFAALDAFISYRAAVETATIVQERMLLGAARVIGEQVRIEDGVLQVVVPPAALELFASPSRDRVFYRATTDKGVLLTGYYDLPLPPQPPHSEEAVFFDTALRDRAIHVVAYSQPLLAASDPANVLVEVGQTLEGRDALARDIWYAAVRRHSVLVGLVAVLLALGMRRAMRPIVRLRNRMLAREPGSVEKLDEESVPTELQPLVAAVNDYARRLDVHMSAHSRFIADASHQLRTPLTLLNTQVSYALRHSDPPAREAALRAIQGSVHHGVRLVKQLLSFSAAEAGAHSREEDTPVDLVELATSVLERESWLAQERGIDLGLDTAVETAWVTGQRHLLSELASNLVDNALRYSPRGGQVTVFLLQENGSTVLRVEDNGPGIPEAELERVFERFYRLHNSSSDGCGLGLSIVREIARLHGATVSLAGSARGRGTVATVAFRTAA